MPDKVTPGPLRGNPAPREAVCIHTRKVYDSCREKECLRDLRVYLTSASQAILENAVNVKAREAELLWANIDVEPITYNRGFYTVDVRYYYRIACDASCGVGRPKTLYGLAVYDKRTVLFGSEGSARIFSSDCVWNAQDMQNPERTNLPVAVVEVVDPVILGCRLQDTCVSPCCSVDVPVDICGCFEDDLIISNEGKQLFVTLGQFSIIKLERDIQLLMPAYDFCMPDKECAGSPEDPCALFQNFRFPVDEFFPPREGEMLQSAGNGTGCGCANPQQNNGCGCSGGNLSRRR